MKTPEELKKWVDSLTTAEKRFIKLLGRARAGAKTSQQLELFDWVNKAEADADIPARAKFRANLPTVSNRLKDLILDGLRLLHKDDNTAALLRTTLDEVATLQAKGLNAAALRQVKSVKNLALEHCLYDVVLQCIGWERRIAQVMNDSEVMETLEKLRGEEITVHAQLGDLRELQHRHDVLLAFVKQFPYHRDARTLAQVDALSEGETMHRLAAKGGYVEQALAVNLLGIRDLYARKPTEALPRYRKLLQRWHAHPAWQIEQVSLLLLICKFYQSACFYCPVNWEEAQQYIAMASNFSGLSPDARRDFQRLLYHNQFTLALNTGKFDSVQTLIPEIDRWLHEEENYLFSGQVLPFLCNIAVAEFLGGQYASAKTFLTRILQMPDRKVRTDIREFALVLQAVLQFESGNTGLDEYLARAGRRHFSKQTAEIKFELTVFRHLEALIRADSAAAEEKTFGRLIAALDRLAEPAKDAIPILGLNEIRMWAKAKQEGVPLREVFLGEVERNLQALERAEVL